MAKSSKLQNLLGLRKHPIAIAFCDSPPEGLAQWSGGPMPSGCAFWQQAWAGHAFYTLPSDHYNCPIGCHTHSIPLPSDQAERLSQSVGLMVDNGYIRMEEVAGIPTLAAAPECIAYGPVDSCGFAPDVVVLSLTPAQAMMMYEAALKAGAGNALMNTLGRPACAVLPLAKKSGLASISLGCIGNRLRTGIGDEEMYLAIPGDKWELVLDGALQALMANERMTDYYKDADAGIMESPVAR
jgi:uncharacterized protein (DUF169 family)